MCTIAATDLNLAMAL